MILKKNPKAILVIDNFKSHRFLLKEELREEGYAVVTAANVGQALSIGRARAVDLIVLEVRLRDAREEGLQALRLKYPRTPWIGYSTSARCPEGHRRWIHFYLPKSSDLTPLKGLIKRALPGFCAEEFLAPIQESSLPPLNRESHPDPSNP